MSADLPPSVNYHLVRACNMRCRYCFAHYEKATNCTRGMLPGEQAHALVKVLVRHFRKISFAGGEPTLCPFLWDLVELAKGSGATTMLVTNAGNLVPGDMKELSRHLDWLTLSIDTPSAGTHQLLGRAVMGRPLPPEHYLSLARAAHRYGIKVKVNTVVTTLNLHQDLRPYIRALAPERWKIFQVLAVQGENHQEISPLQVSRDQFERFVLFHRTVKAQGIHVVPESNELMRGSYAMVDPAGRFYDNTAGELRYSEPILEVGLEEAWGQVEFSPDKFLVRGGMYDF